MMTQEIAAAGGNAQSRGALDEGGAAPGCPDCGGAMRLRDGKYGRFWGCADYPRCKGIRKATDKDRGAEIRTPEQVARMRADYFGEPDMTGVTAVELDCPECAAPMILRQTIYGLQYRCTRFPDCEGSHRAHPSGKPVGTPADKATKQARAILHAAFDKLWVGDDGKLPKEIDDPAAKKAANQRRAIAYGWLASALGTAECHIGGMDLEACQRAREACRAMTREKMQAYIEERLRERPPKPARGEKAGSGGAGRRGRQQARAGRPVQSDRNGQSDDAGAAEARREAPAPQAIPIRVDYLEVSRGSARFNRELRHLSLLSGHEVLERHQAGITRSFSLLHRMGHRLDSPYDIKGRHVEALLARLKAENAPAEEVRACLDALDWLAEQIDQTGLIAPFKSGAGDGGARGQAEALRH